MKLIELLFEDKFISLPILQKLIKDVEHQRDLNFTQKYDVDKKIYEKIKSLKASNIFELDKEFMHVDTKGKETFIKNNYAKEN